MEDGESLFDQTRVQALPLALFETVGWDLNDLVSNSRVNSDDVLEMKFFFERVVISQNQTARVKNGGSTPGFFPFLTQRVDKAS